MHDRELLSIVVDSARLTLPRITEDPEPSDSPHLDVCDVEVSRVLVHALVDGGTGQSSLAWTAEILELTAKVMTHHRADLPLGLRQHWSSVSLLVRTAGLAFAEAVGRVPGTASEFETDVLDVTRSACGSLARVVSHDAIAEMVTSLEAVVAYLPELPEERPFASPDVERVVAGLRSMDERYG